MPDARKLRLFFVSAVAAGSTICAFAPALAAARGTHGRPHQFKVGSTTFTGTPKTVCVTKGMMSDGKSFRFEAWDECAKMRIRRLLATEYKNAPSLCTNDSFTVADIPPGADVIEVSNDYSSVLLFHDKNGVLGNILSGG